MAPYEGRIAGAIRMDDYRAELLAAGFEHVEIVGERLRPEHLCESGEAVRLLVLGDDRGFVLYTRTRYESSHAARGAIRPSEQTRRQHSSRKLYAIKPKTESDPCCGRRTAQQQHCPTLTA
jgi:arsenite methyltransferase